jgi:hypothetical protein
VRTRGIPFRPTKSRKKCHLPSVQTPAWENLLHPIPPPGAVDAAQGGGGGVVSMHPLAVLPG